MSKGVITAVCAGAALYLLSMVVHQDSKAPVLHSLHTYVTSIEPADLQPGPLVRAQINRGPIDLGREVTMARKALAETTPPRYTAPAGEVALSQADAQHLCSYTYHPNDPNDIRQVAQIKTFVATHSNDLERIFAVYRKSSFPAASRTGDSPGTLPALIDDSNLLIVTGRLMGWNGEYGKAIADDAMAFRMANRCTSEGSTSAYWDGQTIRLVALSDIKIILKNHSHDSAIVGAVRTALLNSDIETPVIVPIRAQLESSLGPKIVYDPAMNGPDDALNLAPEGRYNLEMARRAYTLSVFTKLLSLDKLTEADRCSEVDRITDTDPTNTVQKEVTEISPYYRDLVRRDAVASARRAVLICATGVLLARNSTGSIPQSMPDRLQDPFNDRTISYTPLSNNSFVIYSVGDQTEGDPDTNPILRFYGAFYRNPDRFWNSPAARPAI